MMLTTCLSLLHSHLHIKHELLADYNMSNYNPKKPNMKNKHDLHLRKNSSPTNYLYAKPQPHNR